MLEQGKRSPEVARAMQQIDCWFQNHQDMLAQILEKRRRFYWEDGREMCASESVSLDLRSLSEMPLCTCLDEIPCKNLPEGFVFITPGIGWIRVNSYYLSPGFDFRTVHGYFYHEGLDMVFCLTFGQFVLPFETMEPGERLAYVAKRFPHLVTIGEKSGLAVLRGTIAELKEIGLEYGDSQGNRPKTDLSPRRDGKQIGKGGILANLRDGSPF